MENKLFVRFMIFSALGLAIWLFFPFLKSFFAAFLLAIVVFPLHHILETRLRIIPLLRPVSSIVSAALVTLGFSLILFIPIVLFLFQLFDRPADTVAMIRNLGDKIDTVPEHLPSYLLWIKEPLLHLIEVARIHTDEIIATLAAWLGNGLKIFFSMLAEMTMIVVFFFFLTWYGRSISLFILPIVPLSRSIKRELFSEMMTTTAVVFYTFGGVILAQGIAFGAFIAFFDGYNPLLLGFMAGVSSIIPIFGTALVWIPVALNEYFLGHIVNAVIIAAYSWAMMAFFIDNIVKLVILNFVNKTMNSGKHRMNEFIIFFAIVGGLATFGFWGFIFGPAIVAYVLTMLRMLRKTNRSWHP
ncbi:MAG: AI-2E family transporter [Sulfuricurvum sp.]|nr:AI-2E family transporter [Sulfuricurvum sp.]